MWWEKREMKMRWLIKLHENQFDNVFCNSQQFQVIGIIIQEPIFLRYTINLVCNNRSVRKFFHEYKLYIMYNSDKWLKSQVDKISYTSYDSEINLIVMLVIGQAA